MIQQAGNPDVSTRTLEALAQLMDREAVFASSLRHPHVMRSNLMAAEARLEDRVLAQCRQPGELAARLARNPESQPE